MHRNGLGDKLFSEDNHELPVLLKTTPDYIKLNNTFIKTIIVKDIPKEVNNVEIVNQIHDMKNVNSVIEMQASDTANFRKKLSAKMNYNLDQLNTQKLSDLDKYKLELENDYLNKVISHMTKESEVSFKFEVLFQITANNPKKGIDFVGQSGNVTKAPLHSETYYKEQLIDPNLILNYVNNQYKYTCANYI